MTGKEQRQTSNYFLIKTNGREKLFFNKHILSLTVAVLTGHSVIISISQQPQNQPFLMSKRTATSQPVGSPNGKRIRKEVSQVTAALADGSRDAMGDYRSSLEDVTGMEYMRDALDDIWNEWDKSPSRIIGDQLTQLQARVRGVIARGRVIPSLLSPDPTDLRQAVLFCANGCK
jgi:hypothetical protein